ncbi:hypothetical protein [Glycomyces sp. MUSA5-2]|uniref:hypothetical protein n=1 Tax=Glycomyces sp. MUSA5-2 TaxID=2053002 RepID=UPI00300A2E3B
MFTDGSEHRKPRSRKALALTIAAPALASAGLPPAGLAQLIDLTWITPACGIAASGVYLLVNWLKQRGYSVRLVVERKDAERTIVDVSAEFEMILGEDEAQDQNLARLHAAPDGTEDAVLTLVQRLLQVPETEWAEAESEVWRWAADRKTAPFHRVVIATGLARRNQSKGIDLLMLIARDWALGSEIRLMAVDELRRWARNIAASEYANLCADERIRPTDRILAGARLGAIDADSGATALLAIVQDPKLDFTDRYDAAMQSGDFSASACERALWVLANDGTLAMNDRVTASGRLHQLGVPGARELLQSGAANLTIDPQARERCRRFLAETNVI